MSHQNNQKFGIELTNGKLFIVDLQDKTCKVEVDQVVFNNATITYPGASWAEGSIVAVHGLPQEVFELLPVPLARALGVAAQVRHSNHNASKRLYRAVAGQSKFTQVSV